QAQQQQEENRQRQSDQQVLQRMDRQALDQFEQGEADEGQYHEQDSILAGAVGLGIDIDRIYQTDFHAVYRAGARALRLAVFSSNRAVAPGQQSLTLEQLRLRGAGE